MATPLGSWHHRVGGGRRRPDEDGKSQRGGRRGQAERSFFTRLMGDFLRKQYSFLPLSASFFTIFIHDGRKNLQGQHLAQTPRTSAVAKTRRRSASPSAYCRLSHLRCTVCTRRVTLPAESECVTVRPTGAATNLHSHLNRRTSSIDRSGDN